MFGRVRLFAELKGPSKRELRELLAEAEQDRSVLLAEREIVLTQVDVQQRLMNLLGVEYKRIRGVLNEVSTVCSSVGSPNGTTRKIGRIASKALAVSPTTVLELARNEQQVGA